MTEENLCALMAGQMACLFAVEKAVSDAVHGHGSRFQSLHTLQELVERYHEVWELVCAEEGGPWADWGADARAAEERERGTIG